MTARDQMINLIGVFDETVKIYGSLFESKLQNSDISIDDQALKPYLMTTEVQWALASCIDHLETVRNLVVSNCIPNVAAFTLIRSAIEQGTLAIWCLDPDDPQERRRRVLLQAARSAKLGDDALADIPTTSGAAFESKLKKINTLASKLKVAPIEKSEYSMAKIKNRVAEIGELIQSLGLGSKDVNLISTAWRVTSGIAHANTFAGLMLLNRSAVVTYPETDSVGVRMFTSEVEIARLFQLSSWVLQIALDVTRFRLGLSDKKYSKIQELP